MPRRVPVPLQTVAEGIEDTAQRDEMRRLGAGFGQGYVFARPIAPDEIAARRARPTVWTSLSTASAHAAATRRWETAR